MVAVNIIDYRLQIAGQQYTIVATTLSTISYHTALIIILFAKYKTTVSGAQLK